MAAASPNAPPEDSASPEHFYMAFDPTQQPRVFAPNGLPPTPPASGTAPAFASHQAQSAERSPTRRHHRRSPSPSKMQNKSSPLPRSQSHLPAPPSLGPKNIKDLVTRFNQDAGTGERPLIPPTLKDKHRRVEEQRAARLMKPRSPLKTRHHVRQPLPPGMRDDGPYAYRPAASGVLQQSASHDGLYVSHAKHSPGKRKLHQPTFADFDFDMEAAGATNPERKVQPHARRGSDGAMSRDHGSNGSAGRLHEMPPSSHDGNQLNGGSSYGHTRSHSDQSLYQHDPFQSTAQYARMPEADTADGAYFLQPSIPSPTQNRNNFAARSEQAMRSPATKFHKTSRSPPMQAPASPVRRYEPKRPGTPPKSVRAYVKASPSPSPASPPLRSSRPRQPVTLATTAASRAKTSDRFNRHDMSSQNESPRQIPRRKIPELGRVDFAQRRARIEKALSQNLDDTVVLDGKSSRGSSRRTSLASVFDKSNDAANDDMHRSVTVATLGQLAENPLSPVDDPSRHLTFDFSTSVLNDDTDFEEDEIPATSAGATALTTDTGARVSSKGSTPERPTDVRGSSTTPDVPPKSQTTSVDDQLFNATANNQASAGDPAPSRPRTPDETLLAHGSSDQADMTPRQNEIVTDAVVSVPPERSQPETETLMERAIRQYEETGNVDPHLLQEIEVRRTRGSSLAGDGASDVATIEVLLDRFSLASRSQTSDAGQTDMTSTKSEDIPKSATDEITSDSSAVNAADDVFRVRKPAERSQDQSRGESVKDGNASLSLEQVPTLRGPSGQAQNDAQPGSRYSTGIPVGTSDLPSPPSSNIMRMDEYSFALPEIELGTSLRTNLGLGVSGIFQDNVQSPTKSIHVDHTRPLSYMADGHGTSSGPSDEDLSTFARRASEPPSPQPRSGQGTYHAVDLHSPRPHFTKLSSQEDASQLSSFSQTSLEAPSSEQSSTPLNEEQLELYDVQRRIAKRRNVIKELVDTEHSYHRDIKIIEDIYKATCVDLLSADDKRVLFGNIDQIGILALDLYDALRSAVAPFYVVQKSARWQTKRASYTTSSSAENLPASAELANPETERLTAVGAVFEQFLPRMKVVYGAYLKNHEAANKRLAILQNDPKISRWLSACHENASDITSAWNLDSLLVKPVQRFLKYPLLLQQLLVITPSNFPDHDALRSAVLEAAKISQEINDEKKREDLVKPALNSKNKDSEFRAGFAKAFGIRSDKVKERIGLTQDYQDSVFEGLNMKFSGHYLRLQVAMRDFQAATAVIDTMVEKFNAFAQALEQYLNLSSTIYHDVERKWRSLIQAIRELSIRALVDFKAKITKRVIDPLVMAIKLQEGPRNAIMKRKKRLLEYVKFKQLEKTGQKPDKKTVEGAELYMALNEQLKIDLPKLYSLTTTLVERCLDCFVDLQVEWLRHWKTKIEPVLVSCPDTIEEICSEFEEAHDVVQSHVYGLGLCNGSLLAEASQFLSPQISLNEESFRQARSRAASYRTQSIGSDYSVSMLDIQRGGSMASLNDPQAYPHYSRTRSSSQISINRGRAQSVGPNPQPAPRFPSQTPTGFSSSRPSTASRPSELFHSSSYHNSAYNRASAELAAKRSPRPDSGTSASFASSSRQQPASRHSGVFSSAMPMADNPSGGPTSPAQQRLSQHYPPVPASPRFIPPNVPVLFVAASLFPFEIDDSRREAGYPYLRYGQGEVFDIIAQKGELWLARNQDDAQGMLGWIWEQHFVILDEEDLR